MESLLNIQYLFITSAEYFPDVEPTMRKVATQRVERIGMSYVFCDSPDEVAFTQSSSMNNLDMLYKKVRHYSPNQSKSTSA